VHGDARRVVPAAVALRGGHRERALVEVGVDVERALAHHAKAGHRARPIDGGRRRG
jgi:hypothetical protein